jgi:hypothetical protein
LNALENGASELEIRVVCSPPFVLLSGTKNTLGIDCWLVGLGLEITESGLVVGASVISDVADVSRNKWDVVGQVGSRQHFGGTKRFGVSE